MKQDSNAIFLTLCILVHLALSASASFHSDECVGLWSTQNMKNGSAISLEKGGTGQVATCIGLVPLRWSICDDGAISVRYSVGDGFVTYERYETNAASNTLERVSKRTVYLKDGRVEDEDNVRAPLSRYEDVRGDWGKCLSTMREVIEKTRAEAVKEAAGRPKLEKQHRVFKSPSDIREIASLVDAGWSAAIHGSTNGIRIINLYRGLGKAAAFRLSVGGATYINGDDAEEDLWTIKGVGEWTVSIPPSAKLKHAGVGEDSLGRFRQAVKKLGADIHVENYLTTHMFYVSFWKTHVANVTNRSAQEVLDVVAGMLEEEATVMVEVDLWRNEIAAKNAK